MVYTIIPTSDNLMSIYTLITFVMYSGVLIIVGRFILKRFECGSISMNKLQKSINAMAVDLAVVKATIADIEEDNRETRKALAEINRILINKLT